MDDKIFIQNIYLKVVLLEFSVIENALKIIKPDKKCTGFVIWMG